MKLQYDNSHSHYQPQRLALVSAFLLLLPALSPNLFGPLSGAFPSLFSEWNAPKPMHLHLLNGALERHTSSQQEKNLWSPLANQGWRPCLDFEGPRDVPLSLKKSNGYIQVFLDGGLNQQKMGICDAVAVAKILNATLVIPYLDVNPVWQDSSSFAEIFDVDHFINVLRHEISIVKELPNEFSWSTREYYATGIRTTRIKTAPLHASADWYLENVLPVLQRFGIVAIAPFSHRLTFNDLPANIQRLRCKVNFKALDFVPHIKELGETLVQQLRRPPTKNQVSGTEYLQEGKNEIEKQGDGKFILEGEIGTSRPQHSIRKHGQPKVTFTKESCRVPISEYDLNPNFGDMAAHSACDFGGGKAEKLALAKYREVIWQGRVLNSQFTDEELRNKGRCPLTPEEIGLLLAALGFSNRTRLYLASHKVYGGEARISTLRKLFPLMEDKKSLSSANERAKVEGKASLLAAVDYYVSMHSDIFISASPGNMHNALVGHRALLNLKTIRPNMGLTEQLFLNKTMEWSDFQQAVVGGHKNRQGQIRLRKEKQSIYTYPAPDCMCSS